jgi:hypothetical protein
MRVPLAAYPLLIVAACLACAHAQTATCLDVADEPHHQLLFQNQDARVFLLELPRLASTQSHCHSHPYVYIVAGPGRSSNTVEGHAAITRDWYGSEARFIYPPMQHEVRNESINPYRELIVETMHGAQYDSLEGNYDGDLFPLDPEHADPGDFKPTWTVSFTRGALTASKTQLAPGAELSVSSPNHVLLALTDLELRKQGADGSDQAVQLSAQEVKILPGGSEFKLTNSGHQPAKFILVEF